MTDHHTSPDPLTDDGAAAVDQRLTAAVRTARSTTRPPDRHAFLAQARIRRDRLRRRRRSWTIATPIVAAAVVLVAIGVIATSGEHTSMNASTGLASVTRAEPAVDADTPIRVTPDRGLVDGQTVHVAAYAAVHVMFGQCAVVRAMDGTLFYACTNDPSEHELDVPGAVPAGSTDDTPIAQGSFTVHDRLRGRLYLLAYPSGTITGLTAESSDVSCTATTMPIVQPVPAGTGTDTMAPTTADRTSPTTAAGPPAGGSTNPTSSAGTGATQSGCIIMVSGMFKAVFDNPPTAPITFATPGAPATATATGPTCPTKPDTPNTESDIPTFDFTPTALALCTFTVDGERFLDTSAFPEPDQLNVSETIDYLEGLFADFGTDSGQPHCAPDETPIDRVGVVATDGSRHTTAWMATSWCMPSHMIIPYGPDGPS